MTGTLEHIYLVAEKRGETEAREKIELEAGLGIVGDRYHTYAKRCLATEDPVPENHLSLIDKSVLDDFLANRAKDSDLTYADFRRNLITSGIDLNALVDKEFMVGSARCRGVELCEPCAFLAATVHRGVLPGLVNRGGLRAIIIKSGNAEIGSTVTEG
ncbi:MAG: MOSC domain-containing protein [Pseudohongiellaceae bacterium]|jgi:hypothetical protein